MIEVTNITKKYPGTVALDNVSIKFEDGHVHALVGKNGAGKSTLVKILAGAVKPTSGTIIINGKSVSINSPVEAFNKGIATVHQELSLVPEMTVAENILLGRVPQKRVLGKTIINWSEVFTKADNVLKRMNVELDVRKKASQLSVAQQQVVEIAKAMSFEPSALIFDEPTSALAQKETQQLFKLIKELAQKGVVIIYITHRLQELAQIADTVTVLRDGKYISTAKMSETSNKDIVQMMFGEIVQKQRPQDLKVSDEPIMEVTDLACGDKFSDINFTLHKGEILGIAGMLGSGRTELLKAIYAAEPPEKGSITIQGQTVKSYSTHIMKDMGMAFTPEDRKDEALVQIHSIRANMCMAGLGKLSTHGFINKRTETKAVNKLIEKLKIKISSIEEPVSSLSGGNQQKVVVGNWLNNEPRIILFDEPTRGIDVQAKQQIFQVIWDLSKLGISSIVVSSELEELVEICHRILIMRNGRIVSEVSPDEISADELFVKCMG